jgi:hypothetical protein
MSLGRSSISMVPLGKGLWLSAAESIYWGVAVAALVGLAVTLIVMQFDTRTIDGHTNVWIKPIKFEIALAIHAASLALVVSLLTPSVRDGGIMTLVAVTFLMACTIEMGWIILKAAQAQHSHFNMTTPFTRFMYSVMAIMAVIIIGAAGAIGLAVLADGGFAGSLPLKTAIVIGFVGGTILTLITAFTIGGRLTPYVGAVPIPEARMLLTGWSQSGGDLRVSHFLATHMIQVLPIFAIFLDRLMPHRLALMLVLAFGLFWTAITLHEYRIALQGKISNLTRIIP